MPCGVILNWSRRTRMVNMNSLQSASMIQAVPSKRRKSESSYGDGSGCKFVNRGFLTPPSRSFCHMLRVLCWNIARGRAAYMPWESDGQFTLHSACALQRGHFL